MDIVEWLRDYYHMDSRRYSNVQIADEIERLREHRKKMHIAVGYAADLLKDGFINEALDSLEESYAIALQQKESG